MTTDNPVMNEIRGIVSAMSRMYERIKWAVCPICKEQWTKLETVKFFTRDTAGQVLQRVAYTCPPCSYSVRSIPWFSEMFGIPFDTNAHPYRLDAYQGISEEYQSDSQLRVTLYEKTRIIPRGGRVEVYLNGDGEKKSFENIVQAMCFISNRDVEPKKEEQSWGGRKKKDLTLSILGEGD